MQPRRVVITAVGSVTALGLDSKQMWDGLLEGKCGLGPIRSFDAAGFDCRIAGHVPDYNIRDYVPKSHRKATKLMCRDIELAVIASHDAIQNSGLITKSHEGKTPTLVSGRTAINVGAGFISCDLVEMAQSVQHCITDGKFDIHKWGTVGMQSLTPLWLLKFLPNMLPCHVAIIHDIQGPSNTITCGEAGAYLAVTEATEIIQRNDADTALAGGGDSRVNPLGILRQSLMNRINCSSNDNPAAACRPFDHKAAGTILSEAAGILVLEEFGSAKQRGKKPLAEIAGCGSSHSLNTNYFHLSPDGQSVQLAIETALGQAGIGPEKLDLVIPCGSGIAVDDAAEAAGIQKALGKAIDHIPVWPIKGMLGHGVAASGALDLIAAAKAIETGRIGKTLNFEIPASGCQLQIVRQPLEKTFRYVLCCGYSFGGQTAAVLLKAIED